MNKKNIALFAISLTLSLILLVSLSSAHMYNYNDQNQRVQFYQNYFGSDFYQEGQKQMVYPQVRYSISQPYSMYSMMQYNQYSVYYDNGRGYNYASDYSTTKKCDWHMAFYRNC